MIGLDAVILETNSDIKFNILKSLAIDLNVVLGRPDVQERIRHEVRLIIIKYITSAPEYDSLVNDELWHELGVPDPKNRIDILLQVWTKSIEVHFDLFIPVKSGMYIKGGYEINAIKSDFSDVLANPVSWFVSISRKMDPNGGGLQSTVIPWLRWLLLEGDKILVKDYMYIDDSTTYFMSRTGKGLMTPRKGRGKRGWRVPPRFSGTIDNNWITRAIRGKGRSIGAAKDIRKMFLNIIKGV